MEMLKMIFFQHKIFHLLMQTDLCVRVCFELHKNRELLQSLCLEKVIILL